MQEEHTVAIMTIDNSQLMQMAFSKKRMITTAVKRDKATHKPLINPSTGKAIPNPNGAYTKITEWIKEEDSAGFDKTAMKLGDDNDPWFFSYYSNGMLYRLTKDGRVRMESADAKSMMTNQYNEFCQLINMILLDELYARFKISIMPLKKEEIEIKQSGVSHKDENGITDQLMLSVFGR